MSKDIEYKNFDCPRQDAGCTCTENCDNGNEEL